MHYQENINELNDNLKAFPEAEEVFSEKQPWLKEHFLPCISIDLGELRPEWKDTKVHMVNPIEPFEGLIGEETEEYHNGFVGTNYIAFRLTDDNKYEFLADEGYFLRSPIHKEHFNELVFKGWSPKYFDSIEAFEQAKKEALVDYAEKEKDAFETYTQKKSDFQNKTGDYSDSFEEGPYFGRYLDRLGGEIEGGNWVDTEQIPSAFTLAEDEDWNITITYKGNPFYHIASVSGYTYSDGADAVILLYEPISRIALFTYDWT